MLALSADITKPSPQPAQFGYTNPSPITRTTLVLPKGVSEMLAMITFPDMVKIIGGLLLLIFVTVTALGIYFISRSNTAHHNYQRNRDSRSRSKRHHQREYDQD